MTGRVGVYFCSGCDIGNVLSLESLAKVATTELKAAVCRTHACLCGDEGLALIRDDLAEGAIDTPLIAACSPRVRTDRFCFPAAGERVNPERVNLREQVAWCHTPKDEDTQMLAEDSLRMAVARLGKVLPGEPLAEAVSRKILVVGGGVAGIAAALDGAAAGYEVLLVEKEPQLGGFLGSVKKLYPTATPYTDEEPGGLASRIEAVTRHPRVTVLCSTRLVRTEGQPGMFDVTLENHHRSTHRVGAIVMATGWKPYDASKLEALGSALPDVVTNVEIEKMAAAGPIVRPSDGRAVRSVLFLQCAGSRDPEHLPYCSSVCCMTTLKQVSYFREQDEETQIFVLYRDMVTPGPYEVYYQKVQNHPLNFFMKGTVAGIRRGDEGQLVVRADSSLMGSPIELVVDLVVLATGMVANSADNEALVTVREAKKSLERNPGEKQRQEAEAALEQFGRQEGTEILNLAYRQGPDLPILRDGFPDSHFVCFPYETRRTGIYAAGAVRAPMDAAQAAGDAGGAMMKAIQSIQLATRGQAVHPRVGDTSYPVFSLQRCTQCKRCTVECPFGAIDEDEKGTPRLNPYRCRRCGICMGACPERIISFHNYSVDMVAAMVKAIEVPDESEEKPRILVFACENDAYPALDQAGMRRAVYDASVRIVPLRCLGSMNIVWIADALSRGIDGILLLGCRFGDDYQCHFIRGSELANRRLDNVKDTLERLQLESERVQLVQLSIDEDNHLPALINDFAAKIRALGPNPYKGF